jgi:type II secretory ATPase GspE/PulE/Tfp pilus assembly ATPase PilB-like protein
MTGHLVLSTLHTNSSAGTIPRLLDMGAEPFLVASTTNVVVAQRLVRRLCPDCKVEYKMTPKEIKTLEDNVDTEKMIKILSENIKGKKGSTVDKWENIDFSRPKGCKRCNNEGYKGRIGIYEVLDVDEDIQNLITQASSTEAIEKKAREKGMIMMIEDGFIKAFQGITSIEEILRVTKE